MKKNAGIIVLIIWFIYSVYKSATTLIFFSGSTDFYIFSVNHLTPLFFVLVLILAALESATVYALFRPFAAGFYTGLAALALGALENIIAVALALRNPAGVKAAYSKSRELRGLSPVQAEALEFMFKPEVVIAILVVTLVLYAIIALLLVKNRNYFTEHFYQTVPRRRN